MNLIPYILAARPKTLPAAVVPVWLGCILAYYLSGEFSGWLAFCTIMGAVWIQLGTNFFNDVIDSDKGADTERRLGPVRATASGMLSRRVVYGAAILCLVIAAVFGFFLIEARGWIIVAIGIPSLYLCYGYTGGPWPLAYKGLGEVFVVLFFGIVAVGGTVFVQLEEWRWEALLLGIQVGLLSAVLISINNLRDRVEDTGNNKRTLAVLLGEKLAKYLILVEIFLPAFVGLIWLRNDINLTLYPLAYLICGIVIMRGVLLNEPGKIYNKYLALSGLQLIIFAVAFHIAIIG